MNVSLWRLPRSGIHIPKQGERVRLLERFNTLDADDNPITLMPGTVCNVVQVGRTYGKGLAFTLIAVEHSKETWPFSITEDDLVDGAYPFEMA